MAGMKLSFPLLFQAHIHHLPLTMALNFNYTSLYAVSDYVTLKVLENNQGGWTGRWCSKVGRRPCAN